MINITGTLDDKKVKSLNVQFLINIRDYVEIARNVILNNPFQRKRVTKGGSVYELLKDDIKAGCIIPPIVLASVSSVNSIDRDVINNDYIEMVMNDHNSLRILDGLQRTYSLIEVYEHHSEFFDNLPEPYLIRVELYLAISDVGILYRMLTLNTGQTPMSLRHQLEMLYSKYLDTPIDGLNIIREVDEDSVKSITDYRFSDLIDGYNSFLERNELPIDRFDIVQSVRTLENISKESNVIAFVDFVELYSDFVSAVENNVPGWEYPNSEDIDPAYLTSGNPFGKKTFRMFNRSQPLTGYGAAVGELIDLGIINGADDVRNSFESITLDTELLLVMNKALDEVKDKAKKIGNGQRIFFKFFFKGILDRDGSSYRNFESSINRAKQRALAEV